jgi:hypothetical protein
LFGALLGVRGECVGYAIPRHQTTLIFHTKTQKRVTLAERYHFPSYYLNSHPTTTTKNTTAPVHHQFTNTTPYKGDRFFPAGGLKFVDPIFNGQFFSKKKFKFFFPTNKQNKTEKSFSNLAASQFFFSRSNKSTTTLQF